MAKLCFLLRLMASLLALLPFAIAVKISDIFTLEPALEDANGGCDARTDVLDQWLNESIYAAKAAVDAIAGYSKDLRVRRSMATIFGIPNNKKRHDSRTKPDAIDEILDYIRHVSNFLDNYPAYDKADYRLFCHSTFLSEHQPSSPALDYLGVEIKDENQQQVPISNIPLYKKELAKDAKNKPWWAGERTGLKGYYFTEFGGHYCVDDRLGCTTDIIPLRQDADDDAEPTDLVTTVVLCPYSFDGSERPNSYREANNLIAVGKNLADGVPKSATLLHEAFHVVHGSNLLGDNEEKYDIATCLSLANKNRAAARTNPENFVFFIVHMYHMLGERADGQPWSIDKRWDFELVGTGKNRVFGAITTAQQ